MRYGRLIYLPIFAVLFLCEYPFVFLLIKSTFKVNFRPEIICHEEISYAYNHSSRYRPNKLIVFVLPMLKTNHQSSYWTNLRQKDSFCYQEECASVGIRKPHPDIGYYSGNDVNYRKYMSLLAHRFGIHSFAYIYHWNTQNSTPIHHEALPYHLIESLSHSSSTTFCLCVSEMLRTNHTLTSASRSKRGSIYRGTKTELTKHFAFVSAYLLHSQYLRIDGRCLFILSRIRSSDRTAVGKLISLWSNLAASIGVKLLFIEVTKNNMIVDLTGVLWGSNYRLGFDSKTNRISGLENIDISNEYTFLSYWNDWNRQSVLEPTDVDGYDALLAIKSKFKVATGQIVEHLSTVKGRGTSKYVQSLMSLNSEFQSEYSTEASPPKKNKTVLLHLHSTVDKVQGRILARPALVLDTVRSYKQLGIKIVLTIHDFQFLYTEAPNIAYDVLLRTPPSPYDLAITKALFQLCDYIIYPDESIQHIYSQYVTLPKNNAVVVPHPDLILNSNIIRIPEILEDTVINIAYVGACLFHKGCNTWFEIVDSFQNAYSINNNKYKLSFHLFGNAHNRERWNKTLHHTFNEIIGYHDRGAWWYKMRFHMEYQDCEIKQQLINNRIHIVMYLSEFAEAYNYALTQSLYLGLTIVYVNRGAFKTRLKGLNGAFPSENSTGVKHAFELALQYVVKGAGTFRRFPYTSQQTQPTRWYLENYPV